MGADITFVIGRAGSGKSRYLRHAIVEKSALDERSVLLVPEQFTFEAERALSEKLPGGLINADVFSFTTLASRVLENAGVHSAFLSAQGRRMLIRRAAQECSTRLLAFGGVCERAGFCESCDAIFSLYKRCEMNPEDVTRIAKGLGDDLLGRKMRDLALLYEKSEEALGSKYIRAEDALFAVRPLLADSFLRGRHVFVDNCDFWAEQIYGMLSEMMECAASLTVCVRADFQKDCRDKRVFANEYKAYMRVLGMAGEHGCKTGYVQLPLQDAPWAGERYENPALSHLEHELFANPYTVYEGEAEKLTVFAATDAAAEAEAAADAVQRAAKEGLRYREMALVTCDLPAYAQIVQRALKKRTIPYFTDAKHPLSGYPLSRLLSSALHAVTDGYKARDVLELCKTGLARATRADTEVFENYVLRFGLRSSAFLQPFTRGEVPAAAESVRKEVIEPLMLLQRALKEGKTAREKTEALYAYMDALDVRESTENLCSLLREEGKPGLVEEHRQVYDTLMELFSQLHALMGDTPLSTRRFTAMFEEGLSAYEIGSIPATADQLLFGSIDRTRARSVKALFLIGAQEGALPQSVQDDGLIDDDELAVLHTAGMKIWDDSKTHADIARMDAYMAITKPSERLYLSCRTDGENLPSVLLERMLLLFPNLQLQSSLQDSAPTDAEGGFMRLCRQLRAYCDGGAAPDAALYAWYSKSEAYKKRLARIESAAFLKNDTQKLKEETAKTLYQNGGSASRLECFNTCAFKHYARYGLRLEKRREYGEKRTDEGSFCHEALARFTDELCRNREKIAQMTREDTDALLSDILEPLLATHNGGILQEGARMQAKGRELARRVSATAWAVKEQLAAGSFYPSGTELGFGRSGKLPGLRFKVKGTEYMLSGKIDRLDSFTSDAEKYYRVIDYKSGGEDFDFADVYYGLKLQLPLYIAAATELEKAVAAGIYYMPIDDPAVDEDKPLEAELVKRFQMRGITLLDPVIETASDESGYGVLPPKSGRVEREAMERLLAYAREKSRRTACAIVEGEIAPKPVYRRKSKRSACESCEYKSVCRFDRRIPGYVYESVSAMNKDSFMEKSHDKMDDAAD